MAKESRIRISEQYGVNPMVPKCFWCRKDKNEILLLGRLPGDKAAPRGATIDLDPCDKCIAWMEKGIICISVDEDKTPEGAAPPDYWQSGGWSVVKDEAIKRVSIPEEMIQTAIENRVLFLSDGAWDALGFPRGPNVKGHWTVNGICACESEYTIDVYYTTGDAHDMGKPMVCQTTYGEFEKMREQVGYKHGDKAHCQWAMGPCKKEGAQEEAPGR